MSPRLDAQLAFLTEACRLKQVDRQNILQDLSRPENSAEHSWHVALYALLMDHPQFGDFDRDRAIAMILLHDLVEIDAGDHPIHLDHDPERVAAAERAAADRLFAILPPDQAAPPARAVGRIRGRPGARGPFRQADGSCAADPAGGVARHPARRSG